MATWLGAIWIVTQSPFSITLFMGEFNPFVLGPLIYGILGVILATVASTGRFRWARLASFGWSIPAALWYLPGLIVSLGWLFGRGDPCPGILTSFVCFIILLLIVCMPVFWGLVCFRLSRAT